MENAILGRKLGMTQIFNDAGLVVPVTVIQAGPMKVLRKKTVDRDGYEAYVCAFENIAERKLNKPKLGEFKKAGVEPKKIVREFMLSDINKYEIGGEIKCDIFHNGDVVDVVGITKGRGYTGTVKRWNHRRLKMTHGTGPVHRERGSTGANSDPSRVIKGLSMAGQYGHERVTIQNLKIEKVDIDRNVLLVKGAVPGPKGGLVTVKQAVKSVRREGK